MWSKRSFYRRALFYCGAPVPVLSNNSSDLAETRKIYKEILRNGAVAYAAHEYGLHMADRPVGGIKTVNGCREACLHPVLCGRASAPATSTLARISRQEPPEEWRWCMARLIRTRHVLFATKGLGPWRRTAPLRPAPVVIVAPSLAARATLTPYPPSLAVEEIPASASAAQIARNIADRTALPRSTRLTTVSASTARSASSTCLQPRRARAARICLSVGISILCTIFGFLSKRRRNYF